MIFLKSTPVPVVVRAYGTVHLALSSECRIRSNGWNAHTICGRAFPRKHMLTVRQIGREHVCETCMGLIADYVGPELLGQHLELEPGESWTKERVA